MDEERGTQREIAKTYRDRVQSRFTRSMWRSARFLLTLVLFAALVPLASIAHADLRSDETVVQAP